MQISLIKCVSFCFFFNSEQQSRSSIFNFWHQTEFQSTIYSILQEWLDWKFILPSHPLCGILFVLKVLCILIVSLCIIKSQTIWKMHWLHNLFYLGRIHLPPGMWIRPLSQTRKKRIPACSKMKMKKFPSKTWKCTIFLLVRHWL